MCSLGFRQVCLSRYPKDVQIASLWYTRLKTGTSQVVVIAFAHVLRDKWAVTGQGIVKRPVVKKRLVESSPELHYSTRTEYHTAWKGLVAYNAIVIDKITLLYEAASTLPGVCGDQ
jgi:hypothetical protein